MNKSLYYNRDGETLRGNNPDKENSMNESIKRNKMEDELYFLNEIYIVEELQEKYDKVVQERDFLAHANEFLQKLLEEVLIGNSLQSIIEKAFALSGFSIVIHNLHGHPIASAGMDSLSKGLIPNVIYQYLNNDILTSRTTKPILQTINRQQDSFLLLTQPIFLNDKRMGYCSLLFKDYCESTEVFSVMILEKISSICTLKMLYEKTKLDSYEQMKSFFLQEIISGQFTSEDEVIAKAGLLQFDLTKPYYLCLISYSFNKYDFRNELIFCREVMSTLSHYLTKLDESFLVNHNDHHLQLLFTDHFSNIDEKSLFFKQLIKFLHSRFPSSSFELGVSNNKSSILSAPNAYKEAKASIRMVTPKQKVVFFESLGIVGTLINGNNEEDIRNMAKHLLGNLDVNENKNLDLIRTLYTFLLNGGNLEKTADDLSLSISGLRYRVTKIEEMLHKDIRCPIFSSQLIIAIQGLILLGDLTIKASR